jgi:hypothetical protein
MSSPVRRHSVSTPALQTIRLLNRNRHGKSKSEPSCPDTQDSVMPSCAEHCSLNAADGSGMPVDANEVVPNGIHPEDIGRRSDASHVCSASRTGSHYLTRPRVTGETTQPPERCWLALAVESEASRPVCRTAQSRDPRRGAWHQRLGACRTGGVRRHRNAGRKLMPYSGNAPVGKTR